jgi:hypothetical protein
MFIACTSDKDAIHIFEANEKLHALCISDYTKDIPVDEQGYENHKIILSSTVKNKVAALSMLGSLVSSYFNSKWSFGKVKLNNQKKICAFADGNNFIVIDTERHIHLYEIPKTGGYCSPKSVKNIEFCY